MSVLSEGELIICCVTKSFAFLGVCRAIEIYHGMKQPSGVNQMPLYFVNQAIQIQVWNMREMTDT